MGIPGFYGHWLSTQVQQAILNGIPPFVSSLSFDLNGVFHDARKVVFGEGDLDPRVAQAIANTDPKELELELHNTIAAIILRMVQAAKPLDCLVLAVDGVAPGAKMQQQRGRREKSAKEKSPNEKFDRNAITPGTEFMMGLDNFIVRFIGNYRRYLPPKVIYSSHLVPGEGEHKIMDYYRKGLVSDGPAAKEGGAHILYGLDADLIMLSLVSPLNNIYLSRETVEEVVDINNLKNYIMRQGKKPTAIDDFIVMMFLIGNDFLPHIPALEEMSESINLLLEIYAAGDYVLTNAEGINWDGMAKYVQAVALRENDLLASLVAREVKFPSRFLQAAVIEGQFYPDIFRSTWYQNALGPKGPKQFTADLTNIINQEGEPLSISAVKPEFIEYMVLDYMRTMAWVYLYYHAGTSAVNHDWAYLHHHAPMLADLATVMQMTPIITGFKAYEGMTTFTALHQLVSVLPLKSRELLPLELQPLFSYNSSIRDYFPDNFIIEMDGKNKVNDGVPIVPFIDRQRILDAVGQISFTAERAKLWLPAEDQTFLRTEAETELLKHIEFEKRRHEEFLARQRKQPPQRTYATQPYKASPQQGGLVPTMTQLARSPTQGRGRGRGRGRGGRGRGGATPQIRGEIRQTPVTIQRNPATIQHNPVTIQRTPSVPVIAQRNPAVPVITQPAPILRQPMQPIPVQPLTRGQTVIQRAPGGTRGPTLLPQGVTAPVAQIGRGPRPTAPTQLAPIPIAPTSPAQWKTLTNLM